jgi:pyrroloquinoline-quinone synthase
VSAIATSTTTATDDDAAAAPPPADSPADFAARLERESARRYHDEHPFHRRMHAGALGREELRAWVRNRWYYQTRIPIKDAIIVSKSDDPAFRRAWLRRIQDHDGTEAHEGGLAEWRRLARAVGIGDAELDDPAGILPGVRFACDAYVTLVREGSLVEAVASSLTERLAPDLLSRRVAAWERHYPWVDASALAYFRTRVPRARRDGDEALAFVLARATTREAQDRCVAALVRKTEILWHILDCIDAAYGVGGARP